MDSPRNYFSLVDTSTSFELVSSYQPAGDQPRAIARLVENIRNEMSRQVLLGVTGSGKTFTMANVISAVNRPALILAHNKTLAAQLYSEFLDLFPKNAVRYFVSYYDYYQPEAYVPSTDTYIEKDAAINDEIDKLRHAATKALLERRDVIVVSSVSCIYGLGDPQSYFDLMLYVEKGDRVSRNDILKKLVHLQFERNDIDFQTGTFRVRGDVVEVCQASETDRSIRMEFFGDEIEELTEVDRLTGKVIRRLEKTCIYPASHFVTGREAIDRAVGTIRAELGPRLRELEYAGKLLEARRLEQRVLFDLEMLDEMGFCPGIENYSRHLTGRAPGEAPPTLLDYFPKDFLVFVDESHVTVPQLNGMYRGDRSRKQTLVEYGFRLPSALDNRPLMYDEFSQKASQVVFVSATPSEREIDESKHEVIEQIIRPTGLVDPEIVIRPASSQVDDFLAEVRDVAARGERALVTTLTKKMSEDLAQYYREVGVKVRYLHSEVHTLDRIDIIRALRKGEFDLLVGINLLREGLDLPEVSLVGIMDGDKEGFLRSTTSLVQTFGRAARHLNGRVIVYADKMTDSIRRAVSETDRRRELQRRYNEQHNITPTAVRRAHEPLFVEPEELVTTQDALAELNIAIPELPKDLPGCQALVVRLRNQMFEFAKQHEFEKAAIVRDRLGIIEKYMLTL